MKLHFYATLFTLFLSMLFRSGHAIEPPDDIALTETIYATPLGNLKIVDTGDATGAILYMQQLDPTQPTIGTIRWVGKDSAGEDTIYAELYGSIYSNEAGRATGQITFVVQEDGKDTFPLTIRGGTVLTN